MAHTLRSSLSARAVNISHSESLELVSKMFGVADWNTLSAEIESGGQKLLVRSDAPMNRAVRRFFAILCATLSHSPVRLIRCSPAARNPSCIEPSF
ncbi:MULTISPECIES: glyoxalase superfamily protein [unclassified Bradyrhizobium]|nr:MULTISPECIES: glyoxalase superfamily protein [unclassified Bradyrhizobium]